MTAPRVLSSGRLADYLSVSQKTVQKWIDTQQLAGYRIPGTHERRVQLSEALAFAQAHGLPSDRLEQLALRCGLALCSPPSLLVYSPSPDLTTPFSLAGFEVTPACDAFIAGVMLCRRRFEAILLDQAVGNHECRVRIPWLRECCRPARIVLLAGEDDEHTPAYWQALGAHAVDRRPCDLEGVARQLLARLRGPAAPSTPAAPGDEAA